MLLEILLGTALVALIFAFVQVDIYGEAEAWKRFKDSAVGISIGFVLIMILGVFIASVVSLAITIFTGPFAGPTIALVVFVMYVVTVLERIRTRLNSERSGEN